MLLALRSAAFVVLCALGPAASRPVDAPDSARFRAIDDYLQQELHRLRVPGAALAVVRGDRIVHVVTFGVADETGRAVTPATPFLIGSTSKSITALAILQLVEAGRVNLDAPVSRYLAWFHADGPEPTSQVTVRQLLNQTSGIPASAGRRGLTDGDTSSDALARHAYALRDVSLAHRPGWTFEYSNANYVLLGAIIQAVTGRSYEAYVQEHIFDPLGMDQTFSSQQRAENHGMALGYRLWFGHPVAAPHMPFVRGMISAGYLISSVEDMARLLSVHLENGRSGRVALLSGAGIAELHRPAARVNWRWGYGMGWVVGELARHPVLWHNGGVPSFYAFMALLPDQEEGLVLLLNAYGLSAVPKFDAVGFGAAVRLLGERAQAQARPPVGRMFPLLPLVALAVLFQVGWIAWSILSRRWRDQPNRPRAIGVRTVASIALAVGWAAFALVIFPKAARTSVSLIRHFMPDVASLVALSIAMALGWAALRTGLTIRSWHVMNAAGAHR